MGRSEEEPVYTPGPIKLTINVQLESASRLEQLAMRHGVSVDQEFEQMVFDRVYLENAVDEGKTLALVDQDTQEITAIRLALRKNPNTSAEDAVNHEDPFEQIQQKPKKSIKGFFRFLLGKK